MESDEEINIPPEILKDKDYIPISEHEDKWSDVTPIKQYDESTDPGICKIDYTLQFENLMGYFRAIVQSNEVSRRALELTQLVIKENYGGYTAWYWRRKGLDDIGVEEDWEWEITFLNAIGIELQKNYQIWHHRRCIVEKTQNYSIEKEFLAEVFESDDKNYHAWSYRIWLIEHFNIFEGEEEYILKLIQNNPTNNSAWSYRYFIIAKTKEFTHELVENEVKYAFQQIKEFKLDNEACWVYLRGFLAKSKNEADLSMNTNAKRILITEFPFIKSQCEEMLQEYKEGQPGYRFINTLLLDYLHAENDTEKCIEVGDLLKNKYDPIRENYWIYRKQQYQKVE